VSGVSDQVHGISTLKVSLTKLEYVACRKRLKIFRLANLSVEAILQTKFQGLITWLKNDSSSITPSWLVQPALCTYQNLIKTSGCTSQDGMSELKFSWT
jgi:hypothetical protein